MDFELRDLVDVARRWAWLMVLAAAVAAAGSWVGTRFMPVTYASESALYIGRQVTDPAPGGMDMYTSQQLAVRYAGMATRQVVLEGVVEALGLGEDFDWRRLRSMIQVSPVPGHQIIQIRALDTDPDRARVLAATVADQMIARSPTEQQRSKAADDQFIQKRLAALRSNIEEATLEIDRLGDQLETETSARGIAELQSRSAGLAEKIDAWEERYAQLRLAYEGSDVEQMTIIEPASPGEPVGPNVGMNVLLAAAIGFGLALVAVLGLEYLDDTLKTPEDAERRIGLPGLASIDALPNLAHRSEALVTVTRPRSPVAEAYRILRTNLQFTLLDTARPAVVVTSANPGEGKSTTAANLAVTMAQAGKRTILVDADLRRPAIHRFFGLTNNIGLTSLMLDDQLDVDAVMHPVDGIDNLWLVTSGPLPPNPAEMMHSARARAVIDALKEAGDVVIFDTPPVLVVADGAITSTMADATLLVVDSGTTRADHARRALAALAKVGVRPVGAVVNKLDRRLVGRYDAYYGRYYAYHYGHDAYYGSTGSDGGGDGPGDSAGSGAGGTGAKGRPPRLIPRSLPALMARLRQSLTSFLG